MIEKDWDKKTRKEQIETLLRIEKEGLILQEIGQEAARLARMKNAIFLEYKNREAIKSIDLQNNEVLERILFHATEILVGMYGASLVVFHGSRLQGDYSLDSDIDLLVVKQTDKDPMERTKEAERLLGIIKSPVGFDIQVWTPQEVRQGLETGQPYVGMALINGRILHGSNFVIPGDYSFNLDSLLAEAREHLAFSENAMGRNNAISAMNQLFQATERYLKAFIMAKVVKVGMAHNLTELLDQAVKHEPSWETLRETLTLTSRWGRSCHCPPQHEEEVVPTLQEVRELYRELDPWLKTLDQILTTYNS